MMDEQFLLEIEEYAKKLEEDDTHAEDKETPDSEKDNLDL